MLLFKTIVSEIATVALEGIGRPPAALLFIPCWQIHDTCKWLHKGHFSTFPTIIASPKTPKNKTHAPRQNTHNKKRGLSENCLKTKMFSTWQEETFISNTSPLQKSSKQLYTNYINLTLYLVQNISWLLQLP